MIRAPDATGLDALLSPRAVAVVGASQDPTRIGGRPIRYCREMGFAGALYPVNPNRAEIQGYRAWPDLDAIPGPIDCVVIAVPPEGAAGAMAAAVRKGAKGAIVFTANYAEAGPEGLARQNDLVAVARNGGVRVLGPNCLGVFDAGSGHAATFGSFLEGGRAPLSGIGIVSQSGAYASYLYVLFRARGLGAARWIATGNEADVTVADAIGHLAADPGVKVIAAYVEGVKDGPAFLGALEMARAAGKPVVLIKVGRSAAGAEAARSHTASLAGDDQVFEALVAEAGALRVATTEALVDIVEGLERRGPLPGARLGVITISGGAGVLMADAASEGGLAIPSLPADVQARLKAANPLGAFANPVDVTAQAFNDVGIVGQALDAVLKEADVDAVACFFMTWLASPMMGEKMRAVIETSLAGFPDRTIGLAITAPDAILAEWRGRGMIVAEDPARLVATLAGMAAAGRGLTRPAPPSPDLAGTPRLTGAETDEAAAKAFLARAGLPVLEEVFVHSPTDAGAAARRLGRPVALKIVSPDIAHKTEVGGVALDLAPDEVETAAAEMAGRIAAQRPGAALEGFLVAPMAGEGVELILAARDDAVFGPIVMVGLGGIFVEVLKDVTFAAAPASLDTARAMIDRLKGRVLLDGVRGRPAVDVEAAARAIVALSKVAAANAGDFSEIEINPLLVRPDGAAMLDALITPKPAHA